MVLLKVIVENKIDKILKYGCLNGNFFGGYI